MLLYVILFIFLGFIIRALLRNHDKAALYVIIGIAVLWAFKYFAYAFAAFWEMFIGIVIFDELFDKKKEDKSKTLRVKSNQENFKKIVKNEDIIAGNLLDKDGGITDFQKEYDKLFHPERVKNGDKSEVVQRVSCVLSPEKSSAEMEQHRRGVNVSVAPESDELWNQLSALREENKIREIIQERCIEYIFHFTREENIESIIKYGLVPRLVHDVNNVYACVNDEYRFDGRTDTNSLSIGFPNHRMFYRYRKLGEKDGFKWCIFVFKPEILYEKECLFCRTNAASHEIRSVRDSELKGFQALEAMFGEKEIQKEMNLPLSFPIDEQAEVLVKDIIEPQYIHSIIFENKDLYYNYKSKYKNLDVRYDTSMFRSREYFLNAFWRR